MHPLSQHKIFPSAARDGHLLAFTQSSQVHLPLSRPVLLVEIMLDEIGSQKHGLDISLKLIASLEGPLEGCVSLVSMPCIQNLVVGVYPSLHHKG